MGSSGAHGGSLYKDPGEKNPWAVTIHPSMGQEIHPFSRAREGPSKLWVPVSA